MNRPSRPFLARSAVVLLGVCVLHGLAGCGGATLDGSTTGGPCAIDPPGKLTLHVHNGGTTALTLVYGCGSDLPIQLETPQGALSIGTADCALTCDLAYDGMVSLLSPSCGDCGPGVGAALDPGATVDIPWDRRVYQDHDASGCTGTSGQRCLLAEAVAPSATQKGVLSVCPEGDSSGSVGGTGGYCNGTQSTHAFTIDTTGKEATIEVM